MHAVHAVVMLWVLLLLLLLVWPLGWVGASAAAGGRWLVASLVAALRWLVQLGGGCWGGLLLAVLQLRVHIVM
jgi:hypothetical protein